MNWELKLDLWENEEYNSTIEPIISSISNKLDRLVGTQPVLGYKKLWIVNDLYYGMRIYTPYHENYYKLGLTVGHLTFGKVAYQFAHLLSILYTDPRQITWFSNVLAHMSSFWFLDYFAKKWVDNYPSEVFEGSYEAFSELKAEKIKKAYKNVDIILNLASSEWIHEEVNNISSSSKSFAPPFVLDNIGLELLPLFKNKKSWKLFPYVGLATTKPLADDNNLKVRYKPKPDFDRLEEIVPDELKKLVSLIRNKLGV